MNNLNYKDSIIIYDNSSTIIYSFDNYVIKKNKLESNKKYYINEINILKNKKHKNICNLLNYEMNDPIYYLQLEKCDYNLRMYIDNKINHYNNEICLGIIKGLQYLYFNKIVHRDLKPENILIKNNISKISDFGLSKVLENENDNMKTICGTPLYMAPEIIIDKTYTNKIDLWSIGIIFFEILFHKYPYSGNTHNELLTNIISSSVSIPHSDISKQKIDLLIKIMQTNVKKRIDWNELFTTTCFDNDIELDFNDLFDCTNDIDSISYEDTPKVKPINNEIKIINTPVNNIFMIHRTLSDLELYNFNNKNKINTTYK